MAGDPQDFDLGDLKRRVGRLRREAWAVLTIFTGLLVVVLIWLVPVAVRFPAASVPALVFTLIGYFRAKQRGASDSVINVPPRHVPPLQSSSLVWGVLGGAISYAALASLGVGVPNANASLVWRIIGGVAFGAGAGVVAGMIVSMTGVLVYGARLLKRAA